MISCSFGNDITVDLLRSSISPIWKLLSNALASHRPGTVFKLHVGGWVAERGEGRVDQVGFTCPESSEYLQADLNP